MMPLKPSPNTAETAKSWSNATKVIVTADADHVWQDTNKSLPVCDVVPGCLLKKMGVEKDYTRVQLADGREVSFQIRQYRILAKDTGGLPPELQDAYEAPPHIAEHI